MENIVENKDSRIFHILTLFPEMFPPVMNASITGRAVKKGLADMNLVNIRDYSTHKNKRADDTPYGGGQGMLMTAQPIFGAMEAVGAKTKKVVYMSPRGKIIDKDKLLELSKEDEIVILCGHYEGVDQRVLDYWEAEELSIGDYVLTGGELPAMVLMDSLIRLIPGVLSGADSAWEESVYSGLLEYPQYTKPREFDDKKVPAVLLSGNHKKIHLWKFEQSLIMTKELRPDLFNTYIQEHGVLDKEEQKVLEKIQEML